MRRLLAVLVFVGALAAGVRCAGSDMEPNGPQTIAMALSAGSLSLSALEGDSATQSFSFAISNSSLKWKLSTDVPWLSVRPDSGAGSAAIIATARTAGLAAGMYTGNVIITAPGADGSPLRVAVMLTVTARARLSVDPMALSFAAAAGQTGTPSLRVHVSATGAGPSSWSAVPSASWIRVTPGAGTLPDSVTIEASVVGLAAGSYTGTVTITAPGALDSPKNVTVALTVAPTQQFVITATPAPSDGGTVSGGGSFSAGSTVVLVATPTTGFEFVNWTENGTAVSASAQYSFAVTGARSLTANFRRSAVTITTSSSPANGGSTTGGGSYAVGAAATVTASAAAGFSFVNWTEGGTVVSSSPTYSFTVSAARTLVANFAAASPTTFAISTQSNPANGGTTSGGGTYPAGSSATVTATPSPGFQFSSWTEGGAVVSSNAAFTFNVTTGHLLVANFTPVSPTTYTITTSSSPANGGGTAGGGTYASGANVTLTATPSAGYQFANWTEGGSVVSTSSSYTFTADRNRTLVAGFTNAFPSSCTVLITAQGNGTVNQTGNGQTRGGTSAQATYPCGTQVTVSATPAPGYLFAKWFTNDLQSPSPNATFTFAATQAAVQYNAYFVLPSVISTAANPANGGTVSGGGTYAIYYTEAGPRDSVTITATPNPGWTFVNWTISGTSSVAATTPTARLQVQGSVAYVANFAPAQTSYTISATSNPANTATITGMGTAPTGSTVTVTATPKTGYRFVNWTEGSTVVSTSPSYSFTVDRSRSLVANTEQFIVVNVSANPPEGGTATGSYSGPPYRQVTITATPNPGYQLDGWTGFTTDCYAVVQPTQRTFTFTPSTSCTIVAKFDRLWTVAVSANPSAGGSVSGGGTFIQGSTVSVTATPAAGYTFTNWTENGSVVSTSATYSFAVAANRSLVANFTPAGSGDAPAGSSPPK